MSNKHRKRSKKRKERMCLSKVRYSTPMKALQVATKTGETWYKCPYCHGYHLTSKYNDLSPGNKFLEQKSAHHVH